MAWPPAESVELADVAMAAHVVYYEPDVGAFLEAMEQHARRLCVVIITDRRPQLLWEPLWTELHGEPLVREPALHEFLTVLGARGRHFEVRTAPLTEPSEPGDLDSAHRMLRGRYLVREGSTKDRRLRELLADQYLAPDGRLPLPPRIARVMAVVTWQPRGA